MKDSRFDIALMVKVAQMYYLDGLKQEDIAKALSISRSLTSMILTEAKEVGIVEIQVKNPLANNQELSDQFKNIFNLKDCAIIPTAVHDPAMLRKFVAQRACDIVRKNIKGGERIGLGWGRACFQFVDSYKADKKQSDIEVVPMIGGSNQTAEYFQINEMVRVFSEKLGGSPFFIHAPAVTNTSEERDIYFSSTTVKLVSEKWNALDLLICGIGTFSDVDKNVRERYIGERERYRQLKSAHAVGDIGARYFDINGKFIKDNYCDRVIGMNDRNLQSVKTILCLASGIEKANAILGTLRLGLVDILVCDEHTAKLVLEIDGSTLL